MSVYHRDFEEFLASLNARGARYLVVGAHAVAYHAHPRATKDLDLYIEPTSVNAERVLAAIRDFFSGADLGFTAADLLDADSVVQLGVAPVRIDLLCELSGIRDFGAAWERRARGHYGDVEASYLSLDDLILEKESTGRDQDRADAKALRRARQGPA